LYLTYFDDGGKGAVKVFGGIVLDHSRFSILEVMSGLIAVELVPPERREDFEFHASDLFAGTGVFKDVDEEKRRGALLRLAELPVLMAAPYVYSAVDMRRLQKGPARSASWVDMAFFMCACGADAIVSEYIAADIQRTLADPNKAIGVDRRLNLMIIDEPESEKDKGRIRSGFRSMRQRLVRVMQQQAGTEGVYTWEHRLQNSLDDLFFGSSADSIGLQVADVANWIMWRRLCDGIEDEFYEALMKGRVVCAKPEPEWTEFRHLYCTHEAASDASV
jgi:hypothetical protein